MNRRLALIQGAFSLLSLAAVVWWASNQDRPQLPEGVDAVMAMLTAAVLYAGATLARAERWHRILNHGSVPTGRSDSYALTTVGYMGNNVLPARAGEMLRVFLLAPRARSGKRTVFGTIIAERLLDALALAAIFLLLAYGLLEEVTVPSERPLLLAAAGVIGLVGTVVFFVLLRRWAIVTRARDFVRPMAGATRQLGSAHGLGLLGLSLLIWTLEATVYLSVSHAVELNFGLFDALYIVALTNLFAMIPAAPGYVGTFDAAVVFGVKAIGAAGSAVVSYLLLLRFILFVPITVVGLVFLVARYGGWSRYRAARLEASGA